MDEYIKENKLENTNIGFNLTQKKIYNFDDKLTNELNNSNNVKFSTNHNSINFNYNDKNNEYNEIKFENTKNLVKKFDNTNIKNLEKNDFNNWELILYDNLNNNINFIIQEDKNIFLKLKNKEKFNEEIINKSDSDNKLN